MYWTYSKRCVFVTFAFVVILGDSNSVLGNIQCGKRKNVTITSDQGDTVILPCIVQSILEKNQLISWRGASGDTLMRCETQNCSHFPAVMPDDRQRFRILTNYEKNFTIQITNAKGIDSATYYCELHEDSIALCIVSIVTLNVIEQSIQSVTPTPSLLTQEISTTFSSANTSTVSMINSTARSEISTTLLPNRQTQLHASELVILAVTLTTLLTLLLFAGFCCILFGNKLEISLQSRDNMRRRVDIHDSDVFEMKLMQGGEEEHKGADSLQHVLNRERINRHSGLLRPHSDRFKAQVPDKDYLIPQPVSSDESYELVECPDPMYFVVNCSDSDNDGALTTDMSLQPAPSTSTSANVDTSNIISEEIGVLKNTQGNKFSFRDKELPTSPQLLPEDERTVVQHPLLPRIPSPTQLIPPLPPSPPPVPTLVPASTLQRRQQSSRLLPLPPLPKEKTIPSPPPTPPPSTVLPLLPPELHGGYNSLINMTYESAYDRLKH